MTNEAQTVSARSVKSGLKLFYALAEQWDIGLDSQSKLLGVTISELVELQQSRDIKIVKPNSILRLSMICGIRKSIETLYPRNRWVDCMKSPNKKFNGDSLLTTMISGKPESLENVYRYLRGCCGSHYL